MKQYELLRMSILDYYSAKDIGSIQDNKFKSNEWLDWCDLIKLTKDSGQLKLHSDSTGQNMCFTAMVLCKGLKTEQFITANRFYILKSIVGDFVTFYGLLSTSIIYESGKIKHPKLIVVSPDGPFVDLFNSAWHLMLKYYPNCTYVPYSMLGRTLKEPQFEHKNLYSLLFGYEGDLKTNITGDIYFTPQSKG